MLVNGFTRATLDWPAKDDEDLLNGIREVFLLSKGNISLILCKDDSISYAAWSAVSNLKFQGRYSVEICFERYRLIWSWFISINQLGASEQPIMIYEKKGIRKFKFRSKGEGKDDQRLLNAAGKLINSNSGTIADGMRDVDERRSEVNLNKRALSFEPGQNEGDAIKRRRIESENQTPSSTISSSESGGLENANQDAPIETNGSAGNPKEKDSGPLTRESSPIDFYSSMMEASHNQYNNQIENGEKEDAINSTAAVRYCKEKNGVDEVPKKRGEGREFFIISDDEDHFVFERSDSDDDVSGKNDDDDDVSENLDYDNDEVLDKSDEDKSDVNDSDYEDNHKRKKSRSSNKKIETIKQTIALEKTSKSSKGGPWTNGEAEILLKAVRIHGDDWQTIRKIFLKHRSIPAIKTYFANHLSDAFDRVHWEDYTQNENVKLIINREKRKITHKKQDGNESCVKLKYKGKKNNPWTKEEDKILIGWLKMDDKILKDLPNKLKNGHSYSQCIQRVSVLKQMGAL